MNIRRIINQNGKLILQIVAIIVVIFLGIKLLNSYYEQDEERKQEELSESMANIQNGKTQEITENYTTESNSVETTISSFVNYCNKKEIENAYKMLTDECKNAIYPTIEDFEENYITDIFYVTREYKTERWSTDGDIVTYLITLYGDILSTGNTDNYTQDYYTLIKSDDGNYKLNINSYICRKEKNLETTVKNITVKINGVDVYEEYEEATITITNNTSKKICLTGNKYKENIYLQNSKNVAYSSLNSEFDDQELVLEPNSSQVYVVEFNKVYNPTNKATSLVLSDVILDYDDYLNSVDKTNYSNRTSIKAKY